MAGEELGNALGRHWYEAINAGDAVGTPAPSRAL